jgi:hypothetical protein
VRKILRSPASVSAWPVVGPRRTTKHSFVAQLEAVPFGHRPRTRRRTRGPQERPVHDCPFRRPSLAKGPCRHRPAGEIAPLRTAVHRTPSRARWPGPGVFPDRRGRPRRQIDRGSRVVAEVPSRAGHHRVGAPSRDDRGARDAVTSAQKSALRRGRGVRPELGGHAVLEESPHGGDATVRRRRRDTSAVGDRDDPADTACTWIAGSTT